MTSLAEQRLLEFCEVFGKGKKIPVCERTGRSFVARGEIAVIRIAGRIFVPEESLEKFLRERFTPAKVQDPPAKGITASEFIRNVTKGRPRIVKGGET